MKVLIFTSKNQIVEYFSSNYKSFEAPSRHPTVRHEEKEYFCLRLYLLALINSDYINYPIKITKRESPDFIIKMGNSTYGLEVTEATTEKKQRELAKMDHQKTDFDMFSNVEPVDSNPEIKACRVIINAMKNKAKKISNYGLNFRCDLLILVTVSTYKENEMIKLLISKIDQDKTDFQKIGTVSIIANQNLFYDVTGLLTKFPLPKD